MTKGRELDDKSLQDIHGGDGDIGDRVSPINKPSGGGGGGEQPFNAPTTGDQQEP